MCIISLVIVLVAPPLDLCSFIERLQVVMVWVYACGSKPKVPFLGMSTTRRGSILKFFFWGGRGVLTKVPGGFDPFPCISKNF